VFVTRQRLRHDRICLSHSGFITIDTKRKLDISWFVLESIL